MSEPVTTDYRLWPERSQQQLADDIRANLTRRQAITVLEAFGYHRLAAEVAEAWEKRPVPG